MRSILGALLFFSLMPAYGADVVGNGGDAVVCPGSVELLDHYEARTMRGILFDDTLVGADEISTVTNILNRMDSKDPARAKKYLADATDFLANARFIPNANLVDIPDSQHVNLPASCTIKQLAIQRQPEVPEDPLYIVDQDLWNALSIRDRAGLVLHEIIYKEAITKGHTDSVLVRYLNSLLSSQGFGSMPDGRYVSLLIKMRFPESFSFTKGEKRYLFIQYEYDSEKLSAEEQCTAFNYSLSRAANVSEHNALYPEMGAMIEDRFGGRGARFRAMFSWSEEEEEIVAEFYGTRALWNWFEENNAPEFVMCE